LINNINSLPDGIHVTVDLDNNINVTDIIGQIRAFDSGASHTSRPNFITYGPGTYNNGIIILPYPVPDPNAPPPPPPDSNAVPDYTPISLKITCKVNGKSTASSTNVYYYNGSPFISYNYDFS